MGHIVNSEREYRLLQQRLDQNVTGAPYSPVFIEILKMLFSSEEAEIARQIPLRPTSLPLLARKIGMPMEELRDKIIRMAERGLVFDLEYKEELEKKLYEEYNEVLEASGEDRVEELADMIEVIKYLAKLEGKKLEDVIKTADEKSIKRGAFNDRIFLEKVIEDK